MMTHTAGVHMLPRTRPLRTVAVVSRHPHHRVLETVLGTLDHGVVFVESSAHAYSQIKRVRPDLIIVCLSGDDIEICHVLSMLTLDGETSRIPVLTYMTASSDLFRHDAAGADEDVVNRVVPISLN